MLSAGPEIKSPCKLICKMDLESALCEGCGRTRTEIAGWMSYSPAMRDVIMHELPERLEKLRIEPSAE